MLLYYYIEASPLSRFGLQRMLDDAQRRSDTALTVIIIIIIIVIN